MTADRQLSELKPDIQLLIVAAASVANAVHMGVAGMIKGSWMETELRQALGLKQGEMVNVNR